MPIQDGHGPLWPASEISIFFFSSARLSCQTSATIKASIANLSRAKCSSPLKNLSIPFVCVCLYSKLEPWSSWQVFSSIFPDLLESQWSLPALYVWYMNSQEMAPTGKGPKVAQVPRHEFLLMKGWALSLQCLTPDYARSGARFA